MDCSQIVSLVSDIGLVVFTGGLLVFTRRLWRSTERYVDVTDKMARVTERSTMLSEKQFKMERLELVNTMFRDFFPSRIEGVSSTAARYGVIGITDDDTRDSRKQKEDHFCMRVISAYEELVKEVFKDIEEEVAQSESSGKPSSTDKTSGEV